MQLRNYRTYSYDVVGPETQDYSPYILQDQRSQGIYRTNLTLGSSPFEAYRETLKKIDEIRALTTGKTIDEIRFIEAKKSH